MRNGGSKNKARHGRLLLALTFALFANGCGARDPFHYVKVAGKVTYEDGSLVPAERITVTFVPQDSSPERKVNPRMGQAEVNVKDGTFAFASTQSLGDGIVAGRHRVLITAFDEQNIPSQVVPEQYRDLDTAPLFVDAAETPFHFKVPAP